MRKCAAATHPPPILKIVIRNRARKQKRMQRSRPLKLDVFIQLVMVKRDKLKFSTVLLPETTDSGRPEYPAFVADHRNPVSLTII